MDKLLAIGFIREVMYFAWLKNMVVVKKSNEKCWMCMDFTYLNKDCLNDNYYLLKIDRLVKSFTGFEYLASWMPILDITKSLYT
jgi:hypothetical protein